MRTSVLFNVIGSLSLAFCFAAIAAGQDSDQGTALGPEPAIPVYTRFIRISMTGTLSSSVVSRKDTTTGEVGTGANTVQGERLYDSNELSTPKRGALIVEAPMSALKFVIEKGNYVARVRVTASAINGDGKAVWSQQKDITISGKQSKLEARRQGSLYFVRAVTLPGGSDYQVEGKVEDLQQNVTGTARNPLKPSAGAPGINASDAMFVRRTDESTDKFEADEVFSYEGNAFSPILDPIFPAGREFGMQVFFVIYPDLRGAPPEMSLELLRAGRAIAKGALPFKHKLNDLALDGRATGFTATERAHEFPYLADMKFSQLPAGDYEAVITVSQGRSTITRSVPFKVAGTPPPAK